MAETQEAPDYATTALQNIQELEGISWSKT